MSERRLRATTAHGAGRLQRRRKERGARVPTSRSSWAHIVEICTFPRCCPRSRSITTVFRLRLEWRNMTAELRQTRRTGGQKLAGGALPVRLLVCGSLPGTTEDDVCERAPHAAALAPCDWIPVRHGRLAREVDVCGGGCEAEVSLGGSTPTSRASFLFVQQTRARMHDDSTERYEPRHQTVLISDGAA